MNDNDHWQFVVFIVGKFPMQNHKLGTLTKDPPHPEQRQQCLDLCERNSILDYDVENSKKLTGSAEII
ncbi:hypothetical protein T12_8333 [Trichinella patagoniensis]|uniref:Uncharacterized protein n=1 Tax=Trichinella patagoniensis TaxID=990121 RepID=A0A0V0ZD94_9BILA|nr:hypothetical protein T12_8333 [Trichinella patagoniensis]